MGGDQLVAALLRRRVRGARTGDDIRAAEKALYMALIDEVEPLEGARELIEDLKAGGHTVVLASSAKPDEVEHYLDLLDARDLADALDDRGDVEETKPAPDLVQAALEKVGGGDAVMVGDTPWDCEAAEQAGVETIAVLTGGFSEAGAARGGRGRRVRDRSRSCARGLADDAARVGPKHEHPRQDHAAAPRRPRETSPTTPRCAARARQEERKGEAKDELADAQDTRRREGRRGRRPRAQDVVSVACSRSRSRASRRRPSSPSRPSCRIPSPRRRPGRPASPIPGRPFPTRAARRARAGRAPAAGARRPREDPIDPPGAPESV